MAQETAQEGRQKVLETEVLAEYARPDEGGAGGEGLEGLDETMGGRPLNELLDGPWTAFHVRRSAFALMLLPEAQGRLIGTMDDAILSELDRLGPAVGPGKCDHGVGRAEIDADRNVLRLSHARSVLRDGRPAASEGGLARSPIADDLGDRRLIARAGPDATAGDALLSQKR